MAQRRRRLSQKQLRHPDEFVTFVGQSRDFVTNHLSQVLIATGVIIVAILIVTGTYFYEQSRNRQAGAEFYQALTALDAKDYPLARKRFEALIEHQPDRKVGRLARLYLASAYLGEKDLPHARNALVAFVADYHDPLFVSLALANLGVVYERMGDYHKAAGAYSQAASIPGPQQLRAQLAVPRVLEKQGDVSGAIAAYRRFLAAHPFARQRRLAMEALARLGASPSPTPSGKSAVAEPKATASPAGAAIIKPQPSAPPVSR